MTFRSLLVVPQSVLLTEYDAGCLKRVRHRGRSQPSIICADNTVFMIMPVFRGCIFANQRRVTVYSNACERTTAYYSPVMSAAL